jgi:molecular chaperone DnaK (HSP70)
MVGFAVAAARDADVDPAGLPWVPFGGPQIQVTFHVDASGAFSMTAMDARTGRDLPVLQR